MKEEEIKNELTEEIIDESFLNFKRLYFNPLKIKILYPISFQKFTDYLKKESEGIDLSAEIINSIFLYTPRVLYDFFDEQDIFINIHGVYNSWSYSIGPNYYDTPKYKKREEAEKVAMSEAFIILEGNTK